MSTWGPGALTAPGVGEALRTPCGRVHWAGTETAVKMQGFMDGAVQSGKRVAAEIIAAIAKEPHEN